MFWEWFWELYELSFRGILPCPRCKFWPAADCGYVVKNYDYWSGGWEYECAAPDNEDGEIDCDECHHLICLHCRKEIADGRYVPSECSGQDRGVP